MKILIVEDNALVALDLEQQITDAGHTVVGVAGTASKAIDLAAKHGADLALMEFRWRTGHVVSTRPSF
jgi:DNA-binding NarL/FixJ family response regulator